MPETHEPQHPLPSQAVTVSYEVAIDILNGLIGYASIQMHRERHQPNPDTALIESWERRRAEWVERRENLQVSDFAGIRSVLDEDGPFLRSLPVD